MRGPFHGFVFGLPLAFHLGSPLVHGLKSSVSFSELSRDLDEPISLYRPSWALSKAYDTVKESCVGAKVSRSSQSCGNQCTIDVLDITSGASPSSVQNEPKQKIFFLFGEHARELITVELAMSYMSHLCSGSDSAAELLSKADFRIVPNANPTGHDLVEQGYYCTRANNNGVDLNRNWNAHWKSELPFADVAMTAGSSPFSERETQVIKSAVKDFNPSTFVTIHSGTLGMYTSYAYDYDAPVPQRAAQTVSLLKSLDKEYCQCPYGPAAKAIGYESTGSSLDWVFDNVPNCKHSIAFEVYVGSESTVEDLREEYQKLEAQKVESSQSFIEVGSARSSKSRSAVKVAGVHVASAEELGCLSHFNPTNEEAFASTISNWTKALDATVLLGGTAQSAEVAAVSS